MSTHRHASLLRSLSRSSAVVLVGSLLAACSGDAIRFEDALTTSSSMTSNQHAILKKSAPVKQSYPGNDTAEISETSGTIAQPGYNSGIKVSKPQPLAPLAKATPAPVAAPDTSGIKITKPAYTPPIADVEANDAAPAPRFEAPKVVANNKPIILAPRATGKQPLKIVGSDPISTGSIKRSEPVADKPAAPEIVAPKSVPAKGWKGAGGSKVTVKSGETLYNLSRRYGVPVDAIMKANGISDASGLKVGSQILIPAYTYNKSAKVSAPDNNPMTKAARASTGFKGEVRNGNVAVPKKRTITTAKPVEIVKTVSAGQHVVKSGDTLYNISRRYGVSAEALRGANGLSGNNIRLGQALKIPAGGSKVVAKAEVVEAPAIKIVKQPKIDPVTTGSVPTTSTNTDVKTSKQPVAAKETVTIAKRSTEQVNTPAQTASGSFRWPTNGRVITKFGERVNGNTNDGIDISVPVGTPVKAAENGTVIYSGSELADFGNLILVSHTGGWVSAYAHASQNKVKRGDKVSRGQVIAISGKTGNATRPKLHFELRKDSMPVNPLKHLASR